MRKLKIAYTPKTEEVPFSNTFLTIFREIESFLNKEIPAFLEDFDTFEGMGQLTLGASKRFEDHWISLQEHIALLLDALIERPKNLTKKGKFSKFSRYLAILIVAKMHFRYRQELMRWQQYLKNIQAKLMFLSEPYPSVKDKIIVAFDEIFNDLNTLMSLLE